MRWVLTLCASLVAADTAAQVVVGQDGKDVVYLPTPAALVEVMLDLAEVTPRDYVVDLGSGDGRIVIAAAKRGARAVGIEYDRELVALSRSSAAREQVGERASFVEADLFASDFSEATVVTAFLLADILVKLRPKILALRPGSRLVSNSFTVEGWTPDQTVTLAGCRTWCTAHLWIVPARVDGSWRLGRGVLTLRQEFQTFSGTLFSGGVLTPITNGRVRGEHISFGAAGAEYSGRVQEDTIQGTVSTDGETETWSARRATDRAF